MLAYFWELNSKGLHQSSGKEKESCCPLFPSSTKREIGQFHVVVVQRRLRNVRKSVMHVQSCCFACLNQLLFCHSRYCRRRRCVISLMLTDAGLQLYAWHRKEMAIEDVGHFGSTLRRESNPKTVNIWTLSCNLSVFTRVRLLVLWVLETVGVAGIVSGSSFTGRPAFAVNVICKRE